jgi:polysaccharide deacetylase family protein (PEP-CTERM system associated)
MSDLSNSNGHVRNLLTFDVEDYYHILYRNLLGRDVEPTLEVVECAKRILDVLKREETRATFFVVGRVAKKYPHLVREIMRGGHEIASHGYEHIYVNRVTREVFRADLEKSKSILEDLGGQRVLGFRAPEFSIDNTTPWAFQVLSEAGFKYDSSLFPMNGRRYGDPNVPQGLHKISTPSGPIVEVPMSTITLFHRRFPVAGGGYLRVFPLLLNEWAIRRMNAEERGAVVYMHPYEFAVNPSPISLEMKTLWERVLVTSKHWIQLINRRQSAEKLIRLLDEFRFGSIKEVIGFDKIGANG